MKFLSIVFLLLFLSVIVSSNAQPQEKDTRPLTPCKIVPDSNLICDSLFNSYTARWSVWWKDSIHSSPLQKKPDNTYFTISRKELDWLSHFRKNHDSVELFYALTSDIPSQLTALAFHKKHQCRFKKDTARWHKWIRSQLKGNIPVGVKIRHADLLDLYILSKCSDVTSINGYFGFHHPDDIDSNQMIVIFRPVFRNNPIRKKNCEINCNGINCNDKYRNETSSININFTNPCPPCNNSQ